MNGYDVEVTDRDLAGLHGDTICRAISDSGKTVIVLMLTATGAMADRVTGCGLGADEYLPKPFHLPELVLHIRSLARCKPGRPSPGSCARPAPNPTRCTAPSPTTAADAPLM